MHHHHCYRTTAALLAGILILGAGAARAEIPSDVRQERVSFSTAELQSDVGRKRIMSRVSAAARRVCDTGAGSRELRKLSCEHDAKQAAMRDLLAWRVERFGPAPSVSEGQ